MIAASTNELHIGLGVEDEPFSGYAVYFFAPRNCSDDGSQ